MAVKRTTKKRTTRRRTVASSKSRTAKRTASRTKTSKTKTSRSKTSRTKTKVIKKKPRVTVTDKSKGKKVEIIETPKLARIGVRYSRNGKLRGPIHPKPRNANDIHIMIDRWGTFWWWWTRDGKPLNKRPLSGGHFNNDFHFRFK